MPPNPRRLAVPILLALSLTGNAIQAMRTGATSEPMISAPETGLHGMNPDGAAIAQVDDLGLASASTPATTPPGAVSPAEAQEAEVAAGHPAPEPGRDAPGVNSAPGQPVDGAICAPGGAGLRVARGVVERTIPEALRASDPENGDAIAGAFSRLFVWDMDLRRDLRAGDAVAAVWEMGPDGLPVVCAAELISARHGRTFTAFRWQADGDAFASYWSEEGQEVPMRLRNGPIEGYEQVTSLLRDRPSHHGMDFKTPVDTPVTSPCDGVVTRVNFNWGPNGNCIEIEYPDGLVGKFLHLNRCDVEPGERVSAGEQIGLSGNTGHSTGPHLHYQLNRGDTVVDPLQAHETYRRDLPVGDLVGFHSNADALDILLSGVAMN